MSNTMNAITTYALAILFAFMVVAFAVVTLNSDVVTYTNTTSSGDTIQITHLDYTVND